MSNLKQHQSYGSTTGRRSSLDHQLYNNSSDIQEDYTAAAGVFSWPPRSYTCSFCKREFRSAQALGGHMNVHRRDRARLRQQLSPPSPTPSPPRPTQHFSPLPNLNLLHPNPNINNSPPTTFSSPPQKQIPTNFISTLPPLFSTTTSPTVPHGIYNPLTTTTKRLLEMEKLKSEREKVKKGDIIRLELEIGLLGEAKEDLDLELRLGYTTN
ncbi:hypothetical protein M9H77_35423 [Catharanthus roseus]|uniref:Uncharacterized protein n=1 Tax=Catharanthus roseus TaxID=4058 RepID=A0ACB9ZQV2_CATRO|nr:hypothetical protein M9H77_35423 [Catharanthus roseus]